MFIFLVIKKPLWLLNKLYATLCAVVKNQFYDFRVYIKRSETIEFCLCRFFYPNCLQWCKRYFIHTPIVVFIENSILFFYVLRVFKVSINHVYT